MPPSSGKTNSARPLSPGSFPEQRPNTCSRPRSVPSQHPGRTPSGASPAQVGGQRRRHARAGRPGGPARVADAALGTVSAAGAPEAAYAEGAKRGS